MDQETTKNGPGGNDRGNWRERLAAGKALPKISEEFAPADSQDQPEQQPATRSAPEAPPQGAEQPRPRTPVTRPAPMAPRVPRPTTPGALGAPESPGSRTGEARQPGFMPSSSMPSGPARQSQKAGDPAHTKPAGRPPWPASSRSESGSSSASRPSFPRVSLSSGQSQASSTRPPAPGNDAFSERLRAQREAAERLAQQRLAAARQRSAQAAGDAKTVSERRPDANAAPVLSTPSLAQPASKPKPHAPGADMPRFTFADEEIAAAQRESATPGEPAATGGREQPNVPPPYTPPTAYGGSAAAGPAEPPEPPHAAAGREIGDDWHAAQPGPDHVHPPAGSGSDPAAQGPGGAYAVRPRDYAYDDEAMFEAEHPGSRPASPRATAADYSAAYRGFEDDFEDDTPPRRGSGPLILLLSLLVVAMIGGGVIYWYQQQSQGTADTQTGDVPVVNAPAEPVKATPEPEEQPQEVAAPTRRKQIYDRILGEETLEPERLVPTEEQPQFRQIQQPQPQQGMPAEGPGQGFDTGGQNDSTDPRPLPLPPPPGTGEQGDLLLPERSRPVTTTASSERSPALRRDTETRRADALIAPVAQPTSRSAAKQGDLQMPVSAARPVERGSALQRAAREDGAQRQPVAPEAVAINRDDEPEAAARQPARESAPVAMTRGAAAAPTASRAEAVPSDRDDVAMPPRREPVADRAKPAPQRPVSQAAVEAAAAEPTSQPASRGLSIEPAKREVAAEDDAAEMAAATEGATEDVASDVAGLSEAAGDEQGFTPPLPRAKPEPPAAPVQSARTTEPRAEPQRQAPRRSSGPVRITPTLLAPDSASPQSAPQVTQPSAPAPNRSFMGRERDPLAEWRDSSADRPASASQQTASQPAPQAAPQQQVARVEPAPSQSANAGAAGGYVVQLAAFRSEGEAESEFQRLAQSHPQLVGNLSPRVQRASLGQGGAFYRLGIGPVGDRSAATKLCNDLIAAGEKDCLVRRL